MRGLMVLRKHPKLTNFLKFTIPIVPTIPIDLRP